MGMTYPLAGPVSAVVASKFGEATLRWSPLALFAAGENGAWYDPADYLVAGFQDPEGTLPVTALDQPVSIYLDKRFGYARGAELMPAIGTAVKDTGVTEIVGGFRFAAAALNSKAALTPLVPVDNKMFYEVFFTVSNYTGGAARVRVFGTGEVATAYSAGVTANGTYRAVIDPISGGGGVNQKVQIEAVGASNNSFDVTNVTIRELPGCHVWTTTASARPTIKQDAGGRHYLLFDGVNDMLINQWLTGLSLGYPLSMGCAADADADTLGGIISVWGGAPPYYEVQKSSTANQWRAFVRGAVNATATETVGTNATPHVGLATFTATDANLRVDGTDPTGATAQSNTFGTVTEIRIGGGGGGFFNGKFYGGIVRFGTLSATQRSQIERYLAAKAAI